MCERTCPACGSKDHFLYYGLIGTCITCNRCGTLLANKRDSEAAPIDLETEDDVDAWVAKGSFVLEDAEASDPEDDAMFGPNRWPLEGLAW